MLWQFATQALPLMVLGAGSSIFGSLLDSVLGATVQFSGYCSERQRMVSKPGPTVEKVSGVNFLSGNAVNFVAAVTTALVCYYGCVVLSLPTGGAVRVGPWGPLFNFCI